MGESGDADACLELLGTIVHTRWSLESLRFIQPMMPALSPSGLASLLLPKPGSNSTCQRSLHLLDVSQTDIDDTLVMAILEAYPNLQVLDLSYCPNVTESVPLWLMSSHHHPSSKSRLSLQCLNMTGCYSVSASAIADQISSSHSPLPFTLLMPGFSSLGNSNTNSNVTDLIDTDTRTNSNVTSVGH
jgi:hypothetical protein